MIGNRIKLKLDFNEAIEKRDIEAIKKLVGSIRVKQDLKIAFLIGKENEDAELMKMVLEKHPNVTLEGGTTYLSDQCKTKNIDNIKILLSYKSNPNIQDFMGFNCLHYLCSEKQPDLDVLNLIIPHSDLNLPTIFMPGMTPLHFACENANFDLCKILLDSKANASSKG
jgi:ankyrin repeat protein